MGKIKPQHILQFIIKTKNKFSLGSKVNNGIPYLGKKGNRILLTEYQNNIVYLTNL